MTRDFIDLTVEFPNDDVPVAVCTADGTTGTAAYCSEAGNWYIWRPGHPTHRSLWADVHGPDSEIMSWARASFL